MKVALVSGTSIARSEALAGWERRTVRTPHGETAYRSGPGGMVAINRHGFERPLPPHALNYRGYVSALEALGVEAVVSINSVGSLRGELPPGTVVSCADYVSFAPRTFVDDALSGFAPVVDNALLPRIAAAWDGAIETGKIYAQTPGPRFETRAEVRILERLGCDVVGMTFASEADLVLERGLGLTSLCMIDNFAHGLAEGGLTLEAFQAAVRGNQRRVDALVGTVAALFGG